MYRSRIKTPLLLNPQHAKTEPLRREKIKMLALFRSYITGAEERDKIYTDLEALKQSIAK